MTVQTIETITPAPILGFFSNVNTEMGLRGHSHSCSVELEFQTLGSRGWPSFAKTQDCLTDKLKALTARPFKNATNEDVARALFKGFQDPALYEEEDVARWGGEYRLIRLRLGVLGVPDAIGHSAGWTHYTVSLAEED
jgi:hypothetical protein